MQIIFHIDLNAFFANAEIAVNPSLKNQPLVIAHDSRRSIVSTCSYEARKFGIHSAMPLYKAKELCPDIVCVPPHFDLYKKYSQAFFKIVSSFSPLIEVASIDECYCDMTDYILNNNITVYDAAKKLQDQVLHDLSLPCSIGVAKNKFLAKMASDMKKPLGITIITNSNYKELLWPLPISDMFGVGKKTAPKLIEIGIKTIGDLAKYENYDKAKMIFGKNTLIYYNRANGKDYSKMHYEHDELKSVGHSTTFERDSNDEEFIKSMLKKLSDEVSIRAKKRNLVSNTICITLKYTREKSRTKQMIINQYTNEADVIYATSVMLFDSIYNNEMIRLVGVSINNVTAYDQLNIQLSLFDHHEEEKMSETDQLLKTLNLLHDDSFVKASDLINKKNKHK